MPLFYQMMDGWFIPGQGGVFLGGIGMLLFWILIIVGVIFLIKGALREEKKNKAETPLDILKKRYAKGEIDKKEYEEKKKELSS